MKRWGLDENLEEKKNGYKILDTAVPSGKGAVRDINEPCP